MLKTLVVGGAAALVLMTSPAMADGMPGRGPVPIVACCAAPIWTGAYVGDRCVHSVRAVLVYKFGRREEIRQRDALECTVDGAGAEELTGSITSGPVFSAQPTLPRG
jgi:hypothetical protein